MWSSVPGRTVPSRCTCSSIFGYGATTATLAARCGVEAQVLRHVPLPISSAVPTGPDVEVELLVLPLQPVSEYGVCGAEGIIGAHVDPDPAAVEGLPLRRGEQVVPPEVGGVVERARSGGGGALPQRRRMGADCAEPQRLPRRKLERTEAAHRDPADRHLAGVRAREPGGDRFPEHHHSPPPLAPVVPVAVVAAVEQENRRRARAESGEPVEELLVEEARRLRTAPVEEDEEGAASVPRRAHEDLVQIAPDRLTVQGEAR